MMKSEDMNLVIYMNIEMKVETRKTVCLPGGIFVRYVYISYKENSFCFIFIDNLYAI